MKSDGLFALEANLESIQPLLFAACPIALALCRRQDGLFLDANPAMSTLLALPTERIVEQTDLQLGFWDSELLKTVGICGLADKLPVRDLEARIRTAAGQIRTVLLSVEQMSGNGGVLLLCAQDVTDYDWRHRQLQAARKFEALAQFATGFAHDFNNLIAVFQGYSTFIAENPEVSADVRKFASAMRTAAERGANLTRQLMLFGGRQSMEMIELDLNDAVQEIAPLLKKIFGPSIGINIAVAREPLLCRADRKMIQQVLLTLASNAKDAMGSSGTFTIELSALTKPPAAPVACIRVQDTGCGIDPANIDKLFEPFFTTHEDGRGSALGLAAAFGIIKRHEGSIELSSQPAAGTTFQILLPRIDSQKPC